MNRFTTLAAAATLVLACTSCSSPQQQLVWVTGDTYHTKRCADVPRGTRMIPLLDAEANQFILCGSCSQRQLPQTLPGTTPAPPPPPAEAPPAEPAPEPAVPAQHHPLAQGEVLLEAGAGVYHRSGCTLPHAVDIWPLDEAARLGYAPCRACNAPLPPVPAPQAVPPPHEPAPPPSGPTLVIPGRPR